jgi:subtilisin-like proprotein convertase family protein
MITFAPFRSFAVSVCAVALALVVAAPAAQAQVFSNPAPITIPGVGTATPYPSTINVSGVSDYTFMRVRVRLKNFTHSYPADVGVLLVAPSGLSHQLIAPIPTSGGNPINGITLTLSSISSTPLPNPLVTGTFASAGGTQAYNAPANMFPRFSFLSNLAQGNRNGTWQLFVQDFVAGDQGSFAGGWEIEFFEEPTPLVNNAFTYQGRLDGGITDGFINARFSLWNAQFSGSPSNLLAGPVAVNNIPIRGRLFTASVDFGIPLPSNVQTFLQLEVLSPDGSTFEVLSPRQPMTVAPLANTANFANTANTANFATQANTASVANGLGNSTLLPGGNLFSSSTLGIGFTGTNSFVGIGTSTPGQPLDVRGNIAMGNSGELRAASGEENLRIVRGSFQSTGDAFVGSGYTVTREQTGYYVVTFTTPFPALPSVTATANDDVNLNVAIRFETLNSFRINVYNQNGDRTDVNMTFIAIGPR